MSLKSIFFGNNKLGQIKEERDSYKEKSEKLSQEVYELEKILSEKMDTTKSTSFVSAKIQKIEELENELIIQKQRVEETKQIAQEATSAKQDFLANMRHEVRTPMNSIIAFSDMLVHELQDKTHLSHAKNIFLSGHKLLALMDNIIELSRLESGIFEINNKAIDTSLFFNTLVKVHESKAYNKGLLLTLDIDKEVPEYLMLDEKKVIAILDNLISNAIKFTKEGMVNVKVVVQEHNHAQNRINIAMIVADSGIGVDAVNHKKIFEIFEQREVNIKPELQGTGLGLSINKKMAKLLKGDISLSSKLGEGSIFTFTLKGLEVILSGSEDSENSVDIDFSLIKPEGASIMVIDDESSSCTAIFDAFIDTRTKVLAYNNLSEAIGVLQKKKFDLIFIDVNMLSVDENAVSKVIAKMSKAPVVSLTSNRIKDIEFVKDGVEIVGHLKKPISNTELFKVSLKVLNSSQVTHSAAEKKLQTQNEFRGLDKQNIEDFLQQHSKVLLPLFTKAIATNDLNAIAVFAKTLLPIAQKYKISFLAKFSQELLEKIELFEIETITTMMQEYKVKIKRLQNL